MIPAIWAPAGTARMTTAGWMLHGPAVDDRRHDVGLEDVERDGIDQHQDDRPRVAHGQGDEEAEDRRDQRADERDVAAEERQDPERDRERQAEQDHHQPLAYATEGRDDRRADHVSTEDVPGLATRPIGAVAPVRRQDVEEPGPPADAVAEQVEGEHGHERRADRQRGEAAQEAGEGPQRDLDVADEAATQCIDELDRAGSEAQAGGAVGRGADHGRELRCNLRDGQDDDRDEDEGGRGHGRERGEAVSDAAALEPRHDRLEDDRQDQGDDDDHRDPARYGDCRDGEGSAGDDDEHAPAPLGKPIEPPRDERPVGSRVRAGVERLPDRRPESGGHPDDRRRGEHPEDPGDGAAERDGNEHECGVDAGRRRPVSPPAQRSAEDDVAAEEEEQDDACDDRASERERHDEDDGAGEDRAVVRHEACQQ